MKPTLTQIKFAIAAVIVVAGIYWFVSSSRPAEEPAISITGATTPQEAQFLELTQELESITFDPRIFSDPRFAVLVDLTTPVTPETQGRADPFAPVSGIPTKK